MTSVGASGPGGPHDVHPRDRTERRTEAAHWRSKDEIVAEALRRQNNGDAAEIPDTGGRTAASHRARRRHPPR